MLHANLADAAIEPDHVGAEGPQVGAGREEEPELGAEEPRVGTRCPEEPEVQELHQEQPRVVVDSCVEDSQDRTDQSGAHDLTTETQVGTQHPGAGTLEADMEPVEPGFC